MTTAFGYTPLTQHRPRTFIETDVLHAMHAKEQWGSKPQADSEHGESCFGFAAIFCGEICAAHFLCVQPLSLHVVRDRGSTFTTNLWHCALCVSSFGRTARTQRFLLQYCTGMSLRVCRAVAHRARSRSTPTRRPTAFALLVATTACMGFLTTHSSRTQM